MNKTFVAMAALAMPVFAQAQTLETSGTRSAADYLDNRFGAGLMLGEPTGVTVKYWLNETWAIDGGLGGSFHRRNGVQVHSDALWHTFDLFNPSSGRMPLYFGVGGRLKFQRGDDVFGLRIPVGVSYMFDSRPIDVFAEVAPILDLTPSVRGSFSATIGARFWF